MQCNSWCYTFTFCKWAFELVLPEVRSSLFFSHFQLFLTIYVWNIPNCDFKWGLNRFLATYWILISRVLLVKNRFCHQLNIVLLIWLAKRSIEKNIKRLKFELKKFIFRWLISFYRHVQRRCLAWTVFPLNIWTLSIFRCHRITSSCCENEFNTLEYKN